MSGRRTKLLALGGSVPFATTSGAFPFTRKARSTWQLHAAMVGSKPEGAGPRRRRRMSEDACRVRPPRRRAASCLRCRRRAWRPRTLSSSSSARVGTKVPSTHHINGYVYAELNVLAVVTQHAAGEFVLLVDRRHAHQSRPVNLIVHVFDLAARQVEALVERITGPPL